MSIEDEVRQLREQVLLLTQRVYQLEQRGSAGPTSEEPQRATPPAPRVVDLSPRPEPPIPFPAPPKFEASYPLQPSLGATRARGYGEDSLERRIGSQWLNRVGIIAVLVGVSYFLKLAFDNQWIGPAVFVMIGVAAGVAVMWWSEHFRRSGAEAFSYSMKAIGAGVLYLSLWASFNVYHLVPAAAAFAGMVAVTAAIAYFAIRQGAEVLAALALIGGFLTPILVSTHQNAEGTLFTYLLLLDLGALVLQRFERWPRLVFGAWVGTVALYIAWNNSYYEAAAYAETVFFLSAFFLVFAAAPFVMSYSPVLRDTGASVASVLAVMNGAFYFGFIYELQRGAGANARASAYAIGLAALYFGLALALRRREEEAPASGSVVWHVHQGLAASFLTVAIGLRLDGRWITLGWLVESAALYFAAFRASKPAIKMMAGVVLALAVFRLVFIDSSELSQQTLMFNQRFGLYLLTIAVLGAILWLERDNERESARAWLAATVVVLNLLALTAMCLEVHDYFQQREAAVAVGQPPAARVIVAGARKMLSIEREFAYSAVLMAYGVALMVLGFRRRSAFVRWQAIVLIGATVLKVFLYDVSALERVYRVASFIILGAILLAISYAYQKDWLGLQTREE